MFCLIKKNPNSLVEKCKSKTWQSGPCRKNGLCIIQQVFNNKSSAWCLHFFLHKTLSYFWKQNLDVFDNSVFFYLSNRFLNSTKRLYLHNLLWQWVPQINCMWHKRAFSLPVLNLLPFNLIGYPSVPLSQDRINRSTCWPSLCHTLFYIPLSCHFLLVSLLN